jgi:glyoxylase-like metal-dependent hydrolase (beta-lactamase superfamily II)
MNFAWERLADGVFRCRLPFLDVTVGLVWSRGGVLVIDAGTTLTEARKIRADAQELAGGEVSHLLLTHNHFDHILGSSEFDGAQMYCAAPVITTIAERTDLLRADAARFGADPGEVDEAIAALRTPQHPVSSAIVDLGDRVVTVSHPGRGHTDHDLIAVVTGAERTVLFCGDLVEESGDPSIDADSDPKAWPATVDHLLEAAGEDGVYVPGHGAVVDADFVRRQRQWLAQRVTNVNRPM